MGDDERDPIAVAWQSARAAHPGVDVALEPFRAYLDARRPPAISVEQHLGAYCIADLYLACACVAGLPAAIAAFETAFAPSIAATLGRWDRAIGDDTQQRVRGMLLVDHAGRGPLIATYTGRGALDRWVRVVTSREAAKSWRSEANLTGLDDHELFARLAPGTDPAVAAVKKEGAAVFKAAFVASVAELERRERTALRLHLLDGLTIDDIAPVFKVHRATVARWIASAKQQLLDGTRRRLMRELGIGPTDVDSLIRLVQSQIELTEELLRSG